jgi:magnesium chelatase accessory protein
VSAPQWNTSGLLWPHREASRFVEAGGVRWHVQVMGEADAPSVLLLHGTGAATHSWRGLAPLLARHFRVVAADLPGHGFSSAPPDDDHSLPSFSALISRLLIALKVVPSLIIGHSAGAAIAVRMCLDELADPGAIVAINGALLPLQGLPGQIFSPLAKLLAANSLVPRLFSWRAAEPAVTERLLRGTGSHVDAEAISCYGELMRHSSHAAAALKMMAHWDLHSLQRDIVELKQSLHLIVGSNDRTVPAAEASRVKALLPRVSVTPLAGLGHLAHEEAPQVVFAVIDRILKLEVWETQS